MGARTQTLAAVLAGSLAFGVPSIGLAGTVDPSFVGNDLPRCDDCFTGAIPLGFSANYFGNSYNNVFVSNNGYLTFDSGQGDFTPVGLGAGYVGQPIIAPFYADVDTRPTASSITSWATGTYAGRSAFGVTWPGAGVGYFSEQTDKLNIFQAILVDRSDVNAGDFDIYFNYDQIQWETGDASGGVNGLGGISAAVGFNAGTGGQPGSYYQLPGSLVPGSFLDGGPQSLVAGTNDGVAGQYLFQVRNGNVNPVPVPAAVWLFGSALAGMGVFGRRKPVG